MSESNSTFRFPSIADIPEGELVKRLMENSHWRGRILGIHGIPDGMDYRLSIPLDGVLPDVEGDIDILLSSPERPDSSVAIEVKRVKVASSAFERGQPNKLQEIKKAYEQANRMARIGFSQVYCFLFVVVDSRFNNGGQFSYDGLTAKLRELINRAISIEGLNERVGLVQFEFVQPIDDEPLMAGTYGGEMIRIATLKSQSSEVTNWVSKLFLEPRD